VLIRITIMKTMMMNLIKYDIVRFVPSFLLQVKFYILVSQVYEFVLSKNRNMESLEKTFLPTTQVTKRTAGLTLHKVSVDRCSYVLVSGKMKFNVIKQTL